MVKNRQEERLRWLGYSREHVAQFVSLRELGRDAFAKSAFRSNRALVRRLQWEIENGWRRIVALDVNCDQLFADTASDHL